MNYEILLRNGYLPLPVQKAGDKCASPRFLATVYSNLLYYGFAPNKDAYQRLAQMSDADLSAWYPQVEKALRVVTGASKEIGKYIVYKNFPKEVLDMTAGQYWIRQICLYIGLASKEDVSQEEQSRDIALEDLPLKVLAPQSADSLETILDGLLTMGNRWTAEQKAWVYQLMFNTPVKGKVSTEKVASIPFKENLVDVLTTCYSKDIPVLAKISPMDVLRLAAGLSGAPVDLKTKFKFKNFKRKERRFLGQLLDGTYYEYLAEDFSRDKELWKRLLERIHPKDFKFDNVSAAYNMLYNGQAVSNASWVEYYIQQKDDKVFGVLRAGDFVRRLKSLYAVYGNKAFKNFAKVLPELTTLQLVKINRQLEWHNYQTTRMFAPKGNWARVQIAESTQEIRQSHIVELCAAISAELNSRLKDLGPVKLDAYADYVKLQSNDSDMLPYGRGTVFPIPENITFLRSASYWSTKGGWCWMDNGWNFFDENWVSKGACCWNSPTFPHTGYWNRRSNANSASVFSGDPVPSGEMVNKSGQMIDIYLDKLAAEGIRYAVWNVLSFNGKNFDDIQEVYTALQWGEKPQENKTFEPSRAILNAPLKGKTKSKYVAMVDVKERKLIWLDVSLKANVSSAGANGDNLSKVMPAYMEYLDRQPSVADLFINAKEASARTTKNFTYVGYSDGDVSLDGQNAYVFRPSNEANSFKPLNINTILNQKTKQ